MIRLRSLYFRLAAFLICAATLAAPAFGQWKVGAAAIEITPDLPMWMSGYGSRTRPANSVALKMNAKALALEDATGRVVVIVTTDLLGIPRVLRQGVEARVQQQYGVFPENLLINASHTHCGPELRGVETSLSKADADRAKKVAAYQAETEERLVAVVGQALARREPAALFFGQAKAGIAMNRRANYKLAPADFRHGKVPNPDGPVDHDVPILQVKTPDGKMQAVLFGYACHNTTSGEDIFHGDYAGFAQAALEATYPGTVALFMLGCAGDQNPYPRHNSSPGRTSIDLAKLHGQTLASAVEAGLNAFPRPVSGPLRAVMENVALPYLPAPTRSQLNERLASKAKADREYAQVLLEILDRDGRLPANYSYPVQVLQFGKDLTLVALASETVVDFSHRLKRELPGPAVWVAGYSNDFLGYIPSRRIWEEGGYEGGGSLTYYQSTLWRIIHPNIWDPSVEELIVGKVHELARKVSGNR
ncbi:MAG: neutral/alkaline non-lysosomal ceramidase N-terminal domain-containing protein [Verrucomicrobia bacterium]|nr:neutral/alkaline non-lysosomal ceramidase N-terminal domain-containing protein [Verrucomicrobiota bacterium]